MTHAKVISAVSVSGGETVYLTSCDAWSGDVTMAELLGAEDFDWRLAFAQRLPEVTGARLVDAVEGEFGFARLAAA